MTNKEGRRFAKSVAEALSLPHTATRILDLLARTREALSVSEIVRRVRASERGVRANIRLLMEKGLLRRRTFMTKGRRLAYLYSLRTVEDMLDSAKKDFARALHRLESFARKLRESST